MKQQLTREQKKTLVPSRNSNTKCGRRFCSWLVNLGSAKSTTTESDKMAWNLLQITSVVISGRAPETEAVIPEMKILKRGSI